MKCTKDAKFGRFCAFFIYLGVVLMRIVLDTTKGRIILPKSFFAELDKMNKILADGGVTTKLTAEAYVKKEFEKAMKEPMLRAEDKVVK